MSKHTPEPWENEDRVIYRNYGHYRAFLGSMSGRECSPAEDAANAERIVACVNACREFSNEMLLDDGLVKLRNDRDELLAALQSAIADIEFAIEEGHPFGLDETLKILKAKGTNP